MTNNAHTILMASGRLTTDREKWQKIGSILTRIGVVRITSGGNMSRTLCGEAHDGTYALREYSRIVEMEIF
ncbi:MAG: acyl-CoA reductase [Lachnospiraceae bacterium]